MLDAQQLRSQLAKNWKQAKGTSKGEWIHKLCYTHAIGYYLAIRRNEFLPDIMLSYRSWTQKSTHLYLLACNSKAGKTNLRLKKKINTVAASGWGDCLGRDTRELSGEMEVFYTVTKYIRLSKLYS